MKFVPGSKKPIQLLHLEDSSLDIDLIQIQLSSLSLPYSLKHVTTELAFRKAFEQGPVDIVISDSQLPGFDTANALAFVREKHPSVPFIFFSGHLSPEIQAEALAEGACAFIDKNDPGRLVATIERLCTEKPLPSIGTAVIVQCRGFRCLGCRTEGGKWVDFLNQKELPEVLSWEYP